MKRLKFKNYTEPIHTQENKPSKSFEVPFSPLFDFVLVLVATCHVFRCVHTEHARARDNALRDIDL